MKTIGIKLADGTFYPVLEEGEPKKRMLDLTTAKDNQTKVQIDLYRSENGTMDDAEYVDTLEVTKLNPHPNGEPELHLSVGLDEDNRLTAEVVDPETGKKSETEVSLVSRTEAERAKPADFAIAGADALSSSDIEETTFSPDELPDIGSSALEDMPFSFDTAAPSTAADDTSGSDFSELDDDLPIEDTTLESVDFGGGSAGDDSSEVQTDTTTVSDVGDDFSTESFSLPDIEDNASPDDSLDPFADLSGDTPSATAGNDTADFPDFGADALADTDTFNTDTLADTDAFGTNALTDDDSTIADSADEPAGADTLPDFGSDFGDTTESAEPESFDLPDFDTPAENPSDTGATGLDFDDLDDPAFSPSDDDIFGAGTASAGSAMDFSDLYDKETIAGEHASLYNEEDEEKKKTRVPVVICIICAIICVIATILVLFIVPSKYNLIKSRNTNGISILDRFTKERTEKTEKVTETAPAPAEEKPRQEETIIIDVKPSEPAPEAVEDKIIIAPEPEKVVPKPADEERQPESKKTADVKYHIKWGDTLWDLSESYYKTPWKYPKIADYNHIRNPDLIISGTDILIPAE